jgi:chromosome segregation ATPase
MDIQNQMQIIHEETQIKEMKSEIDKLNAKISKKRARIAKKKSQLQIEEDDQTPVRERILKLKERKKYFKSLKIELEIDLERRNANLIKLRQSTESKHRIQTPNPSTESMGDRADDAKAIAKIRRRYQGMQIRNQGYEITSQSTQSRHCHQRVQIK